MPNEKLIGLSDAAELSEATPQTRELSFPISPATSSIKATKKSLGKIQEKKFLDNAEAMLDEFYTVLRIKLRRGDPVAIKIVQEVCGLSPAKGPSVVAQFYNKNEANANAKAESAAAVGGRSFEDLIKKLEARETKVTTASDFIDVIAS